MALTKTERRLRIRRRIRKKISGTGEIPRMSIFRSNRQVYVQFVDDVNQKTLLSISSQNKEVSEKKNISKIEQAKLVGKLTAEQAGENGISRVVFDRGGYLYHGRIKEFAEAARKGGLKF